MFRLQMKRHLHFGDLLEALKGVNRQPSNRLNFIRQPSLMQLNINRQRVSRYFQLIFGLRLLKNLQLAIRASC